MTDFTIITRSLRTRLFSSLVTVLSVAVAAALMLVLLSMRDAGRQAFERGSGNMHLLVSAEASRLTSVLNSVFYAGVPSRPIPFARFQAIADDPRVDFAVPTQIGDSFRGLPVVATTPEFFSKFTPTDGAPWSFARGKPFDQDFQIVLGARAAKETNLPIGAKISLTHGSGDSRSAHVHTDFKYTIVGVLNPTGSAHDRALFTSLNSSWALHAFDRIERSAGGHSHDHDHDAPEPADAVLPTGDGHSHDHHTNPTVDITDADRLITGVYVRMATRPGMNASAVLPQFAAELTRTTGFTIASPTDEIRRLFIIVSNIDGVFLGIAAVVLVSSGIGIMLALYNSMNERRRQIAVLRVLGCSRGRVFGLVVTESAVIGLIGAVAGLGLALGGAFVVAAALKDRLGLIIQPVFAPEWTLVVLLGTVLLAAIAGLVPAVMAYRTSVANNLRPIG